MRSNIVYLTLGDYLDNVPGFIQSVNITIPDDTSFEIARDENGEPETTLVDGTEVRTQQLPKYVEMQMSFKPIHSILPEVKGKFIGSNDTFLASSNLNQEDLDEIINNAAIASSALP